MEVPKEHKGLMNDAILNLLSGCTALKTMELYYVGGFRRLEFNSSKFKRLTLKNLRLPYDDSDHCLEIFAPYVQHLEISGDVDDLECRLVDVSSLVNAKLTFNIKCIQDIQIGEVVDDEEDNFHDYHQGFRILVQDFLQKLSCATELTIGSWFIEVPCMLLFKGMPIPEMKCKYLTLEMHMEEFNLYGVAGLLRASPRLASPHVETLNIDTADMLCDNLYCNFEEDNIDLPSWISSIAFSNLKNVKIANSLGMCLKEDIRWGLKVNLRWGFDKLAELSEVLLKNAVVL